VVSQPPHARRRDGQTHATDDYDIRDAQKGDDHNHYVLWKHSTSMDLLCRAWWFCVAGHGCRNRGCITSWLRVAKRLCQSSVAREPKLCISVQHSRKDIQKGDIYYGYCKSPMTDTEANTPQMITHRMIVPKYFLTPTGDSHTPYYVPSAIDPKTDDLLR
jgi:hypothetical protein